MKKILLAFSFIFSAGVFTSNAQDNETSRAQVAKLRPIKPAYFAAKKQNRSRTTTCGADTVLYPLYKEYVLGSGGTDSLSLDLMGSSANRAASTTYLNSGKLLINGVTFWGLGYHDLPHNIDAKVVLYSVDGFNKPVAELASAQVTVGDWNVSGAQGYQYSAAFSSPVLVTGNYAVAVKYNNPVAGDSLVVLTNDAGDLGYATNYSEGLSYRCYNSGTWFDMPTYWGQDVEYMVFPIVDASIDANLNIPTGVCETNGAVNVNYNGAAANVLNSRFYNLNAFFAYWLGDADSTYIVDIDGALTINDSASASLTTAGTYPVSLTTSLLNYGFNICTETFSGNVIIDAVSTWYADADLDGFGDANTSIDDCAMPVGYVANANDCDDSDSNIKGPIRYYADNDVDGFGDVTNYMDDCSLTPPSGFVTDSTDCDDNDQMATPTVIWYLDFDGDGYGSVANDTMACSAPVGYVADSTDCDDNDANVSPSYVWYRDADGDGFGNPNYDTTACTQPTGFVVNDTDCNDTDINSTINNFYIDSDNDGFGDENGTAVVGCSAPNGYVLNNTDCDDADSLINPNTVWFQDADGDGYGNAAFSDTGCVSGLSSPVLNGTDCDDNAINAWHLGNFYADVDGDGFGSLPAVSVCYGLTTPTGYSLDSTDCDDNDILVYQNGTFYVDADGDGHGVAPLMTICYGATMPVNYSVDSTDCDDNDILVYQTGIFYVDADGDGFGSTDADTLCYGLTTPTGYATNNGDCNDGDINATGFTWVKDGDGDGYTVGSDVLIACAQPTGYILADNDTLGEDCDDSNINIYQSAMLYMDQDGDGYIIDSAVVCYGATIPQYYTATYIGIDCNDFDILAYQSDMFYRDNDGDGYDDGNGQIYYQCYGATIPTGYILTSLGTDCNDNDNQVTVPTEYFYADSDGDMYVVADSVLACSAPTGYISLSSALGSDCDDNDNQVTVATEYFYADMDGDMYVAADSVLACSAPTGYISLSSALGTDCDDTDDQTTAASTAFYLDADNDMYVDATDSVIACTAPAHYISIASSLGFDCDDSDMAVHAAFADATIAVDNSMDPMVMLDGVVGNATYTWYIDGNVAGNGQSLDTTFAADGTYTISLEVTGTCGAEDSTGTTVTVTNTALKALNTNANVSVAPNPANAFVNVTVAGVKAAKVQVLNVNGQVVAEQNASFTTVNVVTVNTSDLANGVYFVKVTANNANSVTRLVINR